MAQALYRTWRSHTFDEIVAQDHITHTLKNALRTGRFAHAYLFTGPRGTGKTSTARIMAKAVNCLAEDVNERPCNKCDICQAINEGRLLDLIEIDAASNRGIDEIRELREKINFLPGEARKKVYVIDEVHMLTPPAFNALLKTLEEPPEHVIFVLATTDPQLVPATVLSRCQRFDFRRIPHQDTVERLSHILQEIERQAEPAALNEIARAATGSLRDAISMMDQLLASGEEQVTLEHVHNLLGFVAGEAVLQLSEHLANREVGAGLTLINRLSQEGTDIRQLTRQFVEHLRGLLILQVGSDGASLHLPAESIQRMQQQAGRWSGSDLVRAIRLFTRVENELRLGFQPQLPLELAFIEAAQDAEREPAPSKPVRRKQSAATTKHRKEAGTPSTTQVAPNKLESTVPSDTATMEPAPTTVEASVESITVVSGEPLAVVEERWNDILVQLKRAGKNTDSLLRGSSHLLRFEGSALVIGFKHSFHKERVERPEHRQLIEQAVSQVLGKETAIRCVLSDEESTSVKSATEHAPRTQEATSSPDPGETDVADEDQTQIQPVARVVQQFAQDHDGIFHNESPGEPPE